MGDQSGVIHLWDLKTDHNEQLVRSYLDTVSILPKEYSVLTKVLFLFIHTYISLDQFAWDSTVKNYGYVNMCYGDP